MGFEGMLEEINAIEAFHEVLAGRKSGRLRMKKGSLEYTFLLTFGAVHGMEGNGFDHKFRDTLHRTGRIGFEQLEEVSAKHATPKDFDTELVKMDLFTRKELREHRISAIKDSMWATFSWKTGEFEFIEERPRDPSEDKDGINLPTAELILEGIRQLEDFAIVEKGMEGKLDKTLLAPQFQRIEAQMRSLKAEEGFILSRIDGTVTAEQVCDLSSLPREQTLRVLYALVASELLEFEEPPVRLEAQSAARPAKPRSVESDEDFDLSGVGILEEASTPEPDPGASTSQAETPAPEQDGGGEDDEGLTPRERKSKAHAALEKGRKLLDREAWKAAAVSLQESVDLADKDPEAWLLLGEALARVPGKMSQAERALMQSIDLNHKNPEPYVELGLLYEKMGNHDRARTQFENALRWDPSHPDAKARLKGDGLKGDLSEALGGVKDTVNRVFKDVFRSRKK